MKREKKELIRFWNCFFFGLYLLLLVYLMFFSEELGRSMLEGEYHYNLIPFLEIRRYLRYRRQIGTLRVLWNLAGNVIGFIPFGMMLPVVLRKNIGFWKVCLLSFELTLFIEISQLVLRVGSCDVDDMILNTLGGCLGYVVYRVMTRLKERNIEKKEKI